MQVDHECVADHCVACCPVAHAYSDGYESAKLFYQPRRVNVTRVVVDMLPTIIPCLLLVIVILMVAHENKLRRERAT